MMNWLLIQGFKIRASTMMLAFIFIMIIVYYSDLLYNFLSSFLPLWRIYSNLTNFALAAVLFALIFLAHSIVRKNPQIQFVVELVTGLLFFFLMPNF